MQLKKKICAAALAGAVAVSALSLGFAAWHTDITAGGSVSAQGSWAVSLTDASLTTSETGAQIAQDYSNYQLNNVCNETYYGQVCNEAAVPRTNSGGSGKTPGTQSTSSTYKVSSWLWLVDTTRFDTSLLGTMNTEERRLTMLAGMEDGSIIRLSDTNYTPDGTKVSPMKAWYYYSSKNDFTGSATARPKILAGLIEQSDALIKQLRPDTYQNYALVCVVSNNTQDCPELQFVIASMGNADGSAASSPVTVTDTGATFANVDFSLPGAWANYTLTVTNNGTVDAHLKDTVFTLESENDQLVLDTPDLSDEVIAPGESCTLNVVVKAADIESGSLEDTGTLSITLPYSQADVGTAPEAGHTHG